MSLYVYILQCGENAIGAFQKEEIAKKAAKAFAVDTKKKFRAKITRCPLNNGNDSVITMIIGTKQLAGV